MKTNKFFFDYFICNFATHTNRLWEQKEKKVQWHNLPTVVQDTITENIGDGKIEEIEKKTKTKNGIPVSTYEIEAKKSDNKEVEIKVREDGKLIKTEDD